MLNFKVDEGRELTHDFHKSSLLDYVGKGNLKAEVTDISGFEDTDKMTSEGSIVKCEKHSDTTVGGVTVAFDFDGRDIHHGLTNILTVGGIDMSITDLKKQTARFFVYINDIDKILCDHDNVHPDPQVGHGTFWVQFAKDETFQNCYNIQHTFEGSGWHDFEISFNTDNITLQARLSMDISEIHFVRFLGIPYKGFEMKVAGLQKITYSNDGCKKPVCPQNGRWLSTFDFDALDGAILTEWYASSFDLENKKSGSSSLSITGHRLHEDFRVVCGGMEEIIEDDDVLHFNLFVSSVERMDFRGSVMRLGHQEGGPGYVYYHFCYTDVEKISLQGKPLHDGWNEIDIPFANMKLSYDTKYYPVRPRVLAEHFCSFINGADEREYTLKYDNLYLHK